ncbi:MAG: isoprenylcysteine carboxylmethyltransferase family protein [Planctomycetota bacterium]
MLFGLRLGALPGLLGSLAWMINPQWMAWSSVTTPIGMRWLGLCLLGLSGMLVVWTFRSLGDNLTDSVVIRKSHTLVVTGPYRFVRHPFYVAFLIAVIGGSLATTNWFLLLAGMVPFGFLVVRTRIEEKKLVERFGDDYRMYQEQTGQFFPRWPRATSLV